MYHQLAALEKARAAHTEHKAKVLLKRLKQNRLGQLYIKASKRVVLVKNIEIRLWRVVMQAMGIYEIAKTIADCGFKETYSLKRIDKLYMTKKNIAFKSSLKKERSSTTILPASQEIARNIKLLTTRNSNCPTTIHEIDNATIFGKSNLVFTDNYALYHQLMNIKTDKLSEELHNRVFISRNPLKNFIMITGLTKMKKLKPIQLEKAANFLDACSENYAHFITEVLPRVEYFCSVKEYASIPLIIDEALHPNLYKALECIAIDRKIYLAPNHYPISIKKLYATSSVGYIPFGSISSNNNRHGFFNSEIMSSMREKILKSVNTKRESSLKCKLYIARHSDVRKLVNQKEIVSLLMRNDFEIYDPSLYSFKEQVEKFNEASLVIGETGAALANLMFCKPDTKVVILMAKHKKMIYGYWSSILEPLGMNITIILGKIVDRQGRGIHGNYSVEPKHIAESIRLT